MGEVPLADVRPGDRHAAALDVVEAQEEVDKRALPGPCVTHDGEALATASRERDVS